MSKLNQLFGIIVEDKWVVTLDEDGSFTTGILATKLNIVQLEEWLKIIKLYKIVYKVKAFQIET